MWRTAPAGHGQPEAGSPRPARGPDIASHVTAIQILQRPGRPRSVAEEVWIWEEGPLSRVAAEGASGIRPPAERRVGIGFPVRYVAPLPEECPPADADVRGDFFQGKAFGAHFPGLPDGNVVFGDGRRPAAALLGAFGVPRWAAGVREMPASCPDIWVE